MEPRKTGTATDEIETGDQEMTSTDQYFERAVPDKIGSSSDQVGILFEEGSRLRTDDVTLMNTNFEKFRLELIEKESQLEADQAEKDRVLEEIRFAVEQLRLTTEQENRELEEIRLELEMLKLRNGNSDCPGQWICVY